MSNAFAKRGWIEDFVVNSLNVYKPGNQASPNEEQYSNSITEAYEIQDIHNFGQVIAGRGVFDGQSHFGTLSDKHCKIAFCFNPSVGPELDALRDALASGSLKGKTLKIVSASLRLWKGSFFRPDGDLSQAGSSAAAATTTVPGTRNTKINLQVFFSIYNKSPCYLEVTEAEVYIDTPSTPYTFNGRPIFFIGDSDSVTELLVEGVWAKYIRSTFLVRLATFEKAKELAALQVHRLTSRGLPGTEIPEERLNDKVVSNIAPAMTSPTAMSAPTKVASDEDDDFGISIDMVPKAVGNSNPEDGAVPATTCENVDGRKGVNQVDDRPQEGEIGCPPVRLGALTFDPKWFDSEWRGDSTTHKKLRTMQKHFFFLQKTFPDADVSKMSVIVRIQKKIIEDKSCYTMLLKMLDALWLPRGMYFVIRLRPLNEWEEGRGIEIVEYKDAEGHSQVALVSIQESALADEKIIVAEPYKEGRLLPPPSRYKVARVQGRARSSTTIQWLKQTLAKNDETIEIVFKFSSETPHMSEVEMFEMGVTTRPDVEANEVVPATLVSSSDSSGETSSGNEETMALLSDDEDISDPETIDEGSDDDLPEVSHNDTLVVASTGEKTTQEEETLNVGGGVIGEEDGVVSETSMSRGAANGHDVSHSDTLIVGSTGEKTTHEEETLVIVDEEDGAVNETPMSQGPANGDPDPVEERHTSCAANPVPIEDTQTNDAENVSEHEVLQPVGGVSSATSREAQGDNDGAIVNRDTEQQNAGESATVTDVPASNEEGFEGDEKVSFTDNECTADNTAFTQQSQVESPGSSLRPQQAYNPKTLTSDATNINTREIVVCLDHGKTKSTGSNCGTILGTLDSSTNPHHHVGPSKSTGKLISSSLPPTFSQASISVGVVSNEEVIELDSLVEPGPNLTTKSKSSQPPQSSAPSVPRHQQVSSDALDLDIRFVIDSNFGKRGVSTQFVFGELSKLGNVYANYIEQHASEIESRYSILRAEKILLEKKVSYLNTFCSSNGVFEYTSFAGYIFRKPSKNNPVDGDVIDHSRITMEVVSAAASKKRILFKGASPKRAPGSGNSHSISKIIFKGASPKLGASGSGGSRSTSSEQNSGKKKKRMPSFSMLDADFPEQAHGSTFHPVLRKIQNIGKLRNRIGTEWEFSIQELRNLMAYYDSGKRFHYISQKMKKPIAAVRKAFFVLHPLPHWSLRLRPLSTPRFPVQTLSEICRLYLEGHSTSKISELVRLDASLLKKTIVDLKDTHEKSFSANGDFVSPQQPTLLPRQGCPLPGSTRKKRRTEGHVKTEVIYRDI